MEFLLWKSVSAEMSIFCKLSRFRFLRFSTYRYVMKIGIRVDYYLKSFQFENPGAASINYSLILAYWKGTILVLRCLFSHGHEELLIGSRFHFGQGWNSIPRCLHSVVANLVCFFSRARFVSVVLILVSRVTPVSGNGSDPDANWRTDDGAG